MYANCCRPFVVLKLKGAHEHVSGEKVYRFAIKVIQAREYDIGSKESRGQKQ